ncbi:hypothetical protein IE4803_PB00167 (plasmid) [Rhizobium etli bv. phaseoli str. IE4803]|nr:hypothetical protein IE4803_PB00167 [Rhizobium etli bv. phaseoli str. IE4803]
MPIEPGTDPEPIRRKARSSERHWSSLAITTVLPSILWPVLHSLPDRISASDHHYASYARSPGPDGHAGDRVVTLTIEQLHWILDGIDIDAMVRHPVRQ